MSLPLNNMNHKDTNCMIDVEIRTEIFGFVLFIRTIRKGNNCQVMKDLLLDQIFFVYFFTILDILWKSLGIRNFLKIYSDTIFKFYDNWTKFQLFQLNGSLVVWVFEKSENVEFEIFLKFAEICKIIVWLEFRKFDYGIEKTIFFDPLDIFSHFGGFWKVQQNWWDFFHINFLLIIFVMSSPNGKYPSQTGVLSYVFEKSANVGFDRFSNYADLL